MKKIWKSSDAVTVTAEVGQGTTFEAVDEGDWQPPPVWKTCSIAHSTLCDTSVPPPLATTNATISATRISAPAHSTVDWPRCERTPRAEVVGAIGTDKVSRMRA